MEHHVDGASPSARRDRLRKALARHAATSGRQFFAEALTLWCRGIAVFSSASPCGPGGGHFAAAPRVTMWSSDWPSSSASSCVGFGVYPAHRASRLDPIEPSGRIDETPLVREAGAIAIDQLRANKLRWR